MSADGRFVAFVSQARDLAANATGGPNVFVRDLQMETTTLVSVNRFGTAPGNHRSRTAPQISADGRFVAFNSEASDLTVNDTNGNIFDVFVRDLQTGTTTLVSVNRFGTGSGNRGSAGFHITADGRFVAFYSAASDLTPNDTNGSGLDVFVRDLQMGTTRMVSINRFGTGPGNSGSDSPAISADGRFVAFISGASDLTANDTNGNMQDVFVRDLRMGTTALLSINRLGTGSGNGDSSNPPVISADGRFVAFRSRASDLVTTTDINGSEVDIFVRPVAP
jgi:Tol biopolymer transport system component